MEGRGRRERERERRSRVKKRFVGWLERDVRVCGHVNADVALNGERKKEHARAIMCVKEGEGEEAGVVRP